MLLVFALAGVVFTFSVGSATASAATFMVDTAPVITTQPTDQTVNAGQPATASPMSVPRTLRLMRRYATNAS